MSTVPATAFVAGVENRGTEEPPHGASKADILPLPFYGALARAHALAAGVEKWWEVTTWPTEPEETTLERGIND